MARGVLESSARTCAEGETTLFWDIIFFLMVKKYFTYLEKISAQNRDLTEKFRQVLRISARSAELAEIVSVW